MPLAPALGRQRQADLREFRASLVYRVSSRTARSVTQRTLSQKNKKRWGGVGKKEQKKNK